MTIKRYLSDSSMEGDVEVTDVIDAERPVLRLKETWFHAQGGGQRADRGRLADCNVIHVVHNGSEVDHYVDSIAGVSVGETYAFTLDKSWRRINAVNHTAGHLVAAVVESEFADLTAVSGHQWPGEGRVEFEGPLGLPDHAKDLVSDLLQDCLDQGLNVDIVGDPYNDRAIRIGKFKPVPCGGTHVGSLREIARIDVTGIRKKNGRLRVSYDAFAPDDTP